jgi:hypothetical protein
VVWQNITPEELVEDISTEDIDYGFLLVPSMLKTDNAITSANLFDLTGPGGVPLTEEELLSYVDTDTYSPDNHVYQVMLAEGLVLGSGTRLLHFVRLDPEETNTLVTLTDDSTVLDYAVDLTSSQKIGLPPERSDIVLDWTDDSLLTKNAIGNEFKPTAITRVMVGHYPDLTLAEIEEQFLQIDTIAQDLWTAGISAGTRISLSELQTEDGKPFTGIDRQGTWLVALVCGSCALPTPWFIGVLESC